MHARLHKQSRRFAGWLVRWMMLASGTMLVLQGCESRSATVVQRRGGAVRLALATSVVAAPGAVIEVTVSYLANGAPVIIARDSVVTNTGGTDATLSLTVDVAGCVRSAPVGGSCTLDVTIRLKRDGAVLDVSTQQFTVGPATERLDVAAVPLYEIGTIRITAPAAALADFQPRDAIALSAVAVDRNGATVNGRAATWAVVSGGVTVSATGVMTGVSVGPAVVRAAMGGRTQDLAVTVRQTSVDSLKLAPADTTVPIGSAFPYRLTVKSQYGDVLTGRSATFASSNSSLAAVSATGLVTAVSAGTATVTVTSNEGRNGATITGTAILRVTPRPQLVVNPSALTFTTALLTALPAAQTVAVTNPGGGVVDPISVITTDTIVVATLDRTTVPAVLTVRATTALAPGASVQREVRVRSASPGVSDGVVTVTVSGVSTSQGTLSGVVANASNSAPITGASVQIRRASDNVVVNTVTTSASGTWTSAPLPAATYSLLVSASGFSSVSVSQLTVVGGPNIPNTPVATVYLVQTGSGTGVVSVSVRDATTNGALDLAVVELRVGANNYSGGALATGTTNGNGFFTFAPQPAGTYSVRATKAGFVDGGVTVTVSTGSTQSPTVFLSPSTGTVAWRFVLQWGATPEDLDAHLTGPIPNSQTRFHVYFANEGSLALSPFARLDVDQTFGFGPETITMSQQFAGTYRYYVYQYSEVGTLRASNARVSVYQGNTLVAQYSPPQQDGFYWTVLEITNGVLIPINAIGDVTPSLVAPTVGPRRTTDRAAAAAAEWYSLAPWNWAGLKPRR